MKKHKLLTKPVRVSEISFDDIDDTINWELKAERREVRRWRRLKHQNA